MLVLDNLITDDVTKGVVFFDEGVGGVARVFSWLSFDSKLFGLHDLFALL